MRGRNTQISSSLLSHCFHSCSSVPFLSYSQSFCQRKLSIKKFEGMMGCSMLAMFGTTDLVNTLPMCNRTTMQMMMPILRRSTVNPDAEWEAHLEEECPQQCLEEYIDTDMSFNLVSDHSHERAWKLWQLPEGRTKEDAVWMELFFKTLNTHVSQLWSGLSQYFTVISS